MALTQAQADAALARLAAIRVEVSAHIDTQWYAPFSGAKAADLRALDIAYSDGKRALLATEDATIAGDKDTESWLALVDLVEASMRSISGYADGASARSEAGYVATETVTTVEKGAGSVAKFTWKVLPWWVLALVFGLLILAVLFVLGPFVRGRT